MRHAIGILSAAMHSEYFKLSGFVFEGFYYMDMGCSISCAAFECISSFLEWVLKHRVGLSHAVHYLDKYLFCGKRRTSQCKLILQTFQKLSRELGIPLVGEKTEGPCTTLIYLGVELDTIQQYSRLPEEKLKEE